MKVNIAFWWSKRKAIITIIFKIRTVGLASCVILRKKFRFSSYITSVSEVLVKAGKAK